MAKVSKPRDIQALKEEALVPWGQRPDFSAPQVSTWLRGGNYDCTLYTPGHEGFRSRKSEISEFIREFDILYSLWSDSEQEDSYEPRRQSGGSICRGAGGGGGTGGRRGGNKQPSNQGQRTEPSGSSAVGTGCPQKSARSGGDDSGNTSRKKRSTRPISAPEHQLQCPIYLRSDRNKKHRCELASFSNFQNMLEHLLRIHIKPLQCAYCFHRFGRGSERTRHQRDVCLRIGGRNPIPVENRVPDYVLAFARDIMASTLDTFSGILLPGGEKQYDYLDNTDELSTSGMARLSFPSTPVSDQPPQLPPGQNVSPGRSPSFAPSPASHAATRSDTQHMPRAFHRATPEHYQGLRRPSALPTYEGTLPQVPTYDTPSLTSPNLTDLAYYRREFLNRVEQEFKSAEQAGAEPARQFARQVATRIPQNLLLYMAEYQAINTPSSIQLPEDPSPERQVPIATPSGIRSPQVSVTNDEISIYPGGADLQGTLLRDSDWPASDIWEMRDWQWSDVE